MKTGMKTSCQHKMKILTFYRTPKFSHRIEVYVNGRIKITRLDTEPVQVFEFDKKDLDLKEGMSWAKRWAREVVY